MAENVQKSELSRTILITPFRKGVWALSDKYIPSKITHLKIQVSSGNYDTHIIYENKKEQTVESFILTNSSYMKKYPYAFRDIFETPYNIDKDIKEYINKNRYLSLLFVEYPARVYHYSCNYSSHK
jgi:hypothetical protein